MKFLNDEYTLNIDDLGYKNQIDTIRKLIINAETPFSIGISGRWGSGKTSAMKYLMASLGGKPLKHRLDFQTETITESGNFSKVFKKFKDENKVKKKVKRIQTIWFNPWENEKHKEPLVALLHEIYSHFSFLSKIKSEIEKSMELSIQAGLDMIGSFFKLGKNIATSISTNDEKYDFDHFRYVDRSQKFKLIFEEAVKKLLKVKNNDKSARLVIFIDDLDRCEDNTIAILLKEIKQYLSTKRCVFVFGYDKHHIEKSLSKSETKTSKETRAYLEKLFQTTFFLKPPKEKLILSFIGNIINDFNLKFKGQDKEENKKLLDELKKFIISIIDPNPRRLKTYLTTFYFHIENSSFDIDKSISLDDYKKLALIAYLKLFYESVYSVLENHNDLLTDLIIVCQNRNIIDSTNQRLYYLHLELRSHIHKIDVDYSEKMEYSVDYEEKFLNEVYEMQGRHKTFETFMEEFARHFKDNKEIEKYL